MEISIIALRRRRERRKVDMCVSKVAGLAAEAVAVSGVTMANICTEECIDGRRGKVNGVRYILMGTTIWVTDYLPGNPTYQNNLLRRWFRVRRAIVLKRHTDLPFYVAAAWKKRRDDIGRDGIMLNIKIIVFLQLLGSGRSIDDSAQMVRETILFYFNRFWKDGWENYGEVYLNGRSGPEEL